MYKEIFNLVMALVFNPRKTWIDIKKEECENENFLSRFVYPLIGLITAAAFVGVLFTHKEFDVELALKSAIIASVAAFGGFFISSYLLNDLVLPFFNIPKNLKYCQRYVGYASSLMFSLNILFMLLPEFFLLRIFVFYTFYMVWESIGVMWKVEENRRLAFVCILTALITLMPWLVELVMAFCMPGLRV